MSLLNKNNIALLHEMCDTDFNECLVIGVKPRNDEITGAMRAFTLETELYKMDFSRESITSTVKGITEFSEQGFRGEVCWPEGIGFVLLHTEYGMFKERFKSLELEAETATCN